MKDLAKSIDAGITAVDRPMSPVLGGITKRGMDIIGASLGLILIAPLFVLLAALVKFSDGGSVLYGHRRIGRGGRVFQCLKFRTMVPNGDEVLAAHLRDNPEARGEWKRDHKLKDDPRVTRVGAVLRKLSLDELPQIINILHGDMSIVGPRPVVHAELERYGQAASHYLSTRPGLTGLWQINGRNNVSYDARVQFDKHYVENWSATWDVVIIVKTIPAVWMARGSY